MSEGTRRVDVDRVWRGHWKLARTRILRLSARMWTVVYLPGSSLGGERGLGESRAGLVD